MGTGEVLAVLAAGFGAGVLNTVVGSGTLLTFPILVSIGIPPIQANIANNIGLAPGSISGAVGYRSELTGPAWRVIACCAAAAGGGALGAILLFLLPDKTFESIVPWLIGVAVLLIAVQPVVSKWLPKNQEPAQRPSRGKSTLLIVSVFLASVYGGYFGAAQGVILIAVMSLLMEQSLQAINALKNLLQGVDNLVSALLYISISQVDWLIVALLGSGSIIGGQVGALVAKRVPDAWFRIAIVIVGMVGLVVFVGN
ncbi:sulfite exporter TauE/SafE family protein [Amycolatopsis umgeniensis]|uniref:Probable membrane transporter protein n=1 Tax=Amycolatopsis umgeniensis TaxID=336628 RepID=A0A841B9U9_9PSEU|nr:sulfite exporter TauE/SafE family protein [Amycolatopsis umgeniensis]MBB5855681.1 putative membrane protein YfcA [Amycolatopsis umgeniensis]